jgi:hypothetical protein
MWTKRKASVFLIILQCAPFAYADNFPTPAQPFPAETGRPSSRIDYLSMRFSSIREKTNDEPPARAEIVNPQTRATPSATDTPGIHWTIDDHRTGLEYRMPGQGAIRIHMSHHGGEALGIWNF